MPGTGAMPTGVTVTETGRIFVNFPRWGDDVPYTVAELKDGKPVAFDPNDDKEAVTGELFTDAAVTDAGSMPSSNGATHGSSRFSERFSAKTSRL